MVYDSLLSVVLAIIIFSEFTHFATVVEDVLLFENFLFQKLSSPNAVSEGQTAVYTVKLDGPPPTDVHIGLRNTDTFIRYS